MKIKYAIKDHTDETYYTGTDGWSPEIIHAWFLETLEDAEDIVSQIILPSMLLEIIKIYIR